MQFFKSTYKVTSGFDSPPVHGPLLHRPHHRPQSGRVRRDLLTVNARTTTSGMTSVDFDNRWPPAKRARSDKARLRRFWNLMLDAIGRIG